MFRSGISCLSRCCADTPFSLIVHASLPAKSAKELVAFARANPGKLKYGVSGIGGAPHLAGELFNITAKVDTLHVNYKGAGPMLTDLLATTGAEPANNTPEQFGQFMKEERQRWDKVIKAASIKLDS